MRHVPTDRYIVFKYLGLLFFFIPVMGDTALVFPPSEQGEGAGVRELLIVFGVYMVIVGVIIGLVIGGYVYRIVVIKIKLEAAWQSNMEEDDTLVQDKGVNNSKVGSRFSGGISSFVYA